MSTGSMQRPPATPSAPPPPTLPPALAPPPRRNPVMIFASVALILVCGIVGWWAVSRATAKDAVLALARTVPYGQPITAADLTVAHLPADAALAPIPAADAGQVLGHPAATTLSAGTVLVRADVAATSVIPAGSTVVWVPVAGNRISSAGLSAQQRVELVYAPTSAALATAPSPGPGSGSAAAISGTVLSIAPATPDGTIVVAVIVAQDRAATLATWAATASVELTAVGSQGP